MNQKFIDQLTTKVQQDKDVLAFDEALLALATTGWQTDQAAQTQAISDALAPIVEQVSSLQTTLETNQATLEVKTTPTV